MADALSAFLDLLPAAEILRTIVDEAETSLRRSTRLIQES